MKSAAILVGLVLVGCASPRNPPAGSPGTAPEAIGLPPVVKVLALFLTDSKQGEVAAVRVDGVLVAALHTVAGASLITITRGDGKAVPGRIIAIDDQADLAILAADLGITPAAKLATVPPVPGDEVKAIGREGNASAGKITAIESNSFGDDLYTNAPYGPGDTGGALLNGRGELVGILLGDGEGDRRLATGGKPLASLCKRGGPR